MTGRDGVLVAAFAEVIVAHQRIPLYDGTGGQRCTRGCDSLYGETDGPNSPRHAAHVAAVLVASPAMNAHRAAVLEAAADQLLVVNVREHGDRCYCQVCAAFEDAARRVRAAAQPETEEAGT